MNMKDIVMSIARQTAPILDSSNDEPHHSQTAVSLQLMRDNARRSLEQTRAAIAAPGDNGLSVPLPMPGPEDVSIKQALEAAFLHLEALKKRADAGGDNGCDPLDWSEELLDFVEIAHLSRAHRG